MKKIQYCFILLLLLGALVAPGATYAQDLQLTDSPVCLRNVLVEKQENALTVDFDLVLDSLRLRSNKGLVFTPKLTGTDESQNLPSVEVLGRKRYIYYQRNGVTATENPLLVTRRMNGKSQTEHYSYRLPYQKWMNNSMLLMAQDVCACRQDVVAYGTSDSLGNFKFERPVPHYELAYIQPDVQAAKTREVAGSAQLKFPLNSYEIVPSLANNQTELDKIQSIIDEIASDEDFSIRSIELHGYASPDGKYDRNDFLAKNRTEALKQYLLEKYPQIRDGQYRVNSTAEDWVGFRRYVERANWEDKEVFLSVIDSEKDPDSKERFLRTNYPSIFKQELLTNVFPSLRRTDYNVNYEVRVFNLEEAKRLVHTAPQKLSLAEMFSVAKSYEKGSEEFNEVFEVAARMFPDSETANLNAGCAALERGDLVGAAKFLALAGNGAEAQNARGVMAAKSGDYDKAETCFRAAASLPEAQRNLQRMEESR